MSGIMYYAAGPTGVVSLALAKSWGLAHAFSEAPFARECQNRTPDGGSGLVFGDEGRLAPHTVKMSLDEQEWRRLPDREGRPALWLGWWKEAPPTPDGLARKRQLPGHGPLLNDGNAWTIPLVRQFEGTREQWECFLPCVLVQDAAGKLVKGEVVAAYRRLWKATEAAWQAVVNTSQIEQSEVLAVLGELVATNYVIGIEEFVALGTLSEELGPDELVLMALDYFHFAAVAAAKKKMRPSLPTAGMISSVGGADLLPATAPPEPISLS